MDRTIGKNIIRFVPFLLLLQWITTGEDTVLLSIINRENLLLIGKSLLMSGIVALLATLTGTICAFLLPNR